MSRPLRIEIEATRGGELLAARWSVQALELREKLDRPYEATVTVAIEDDAPTARELLGVRVEITIVPAEGEPRRMVGVVQHSRYVRTHRATTAFELKVGPAVGLLAHARRRRIFEDRTALEIAASVVREATERFGGALDLASLTGHCEVRDYTAQWDETDLDFLLRILAEEGIFMAFDHEGPEETLRLLDANAAFVGVGETAGCEGRRASDPSVTTLAFDPNPGPHREAVQVLRRIEGFEAASHVTSQWAWKAPEPFAFEAVRIGERCGSFGSVAHHGTDRLREVDRGEGPQLDRSAQIADRQAAIETLGASALHGQSNVMALSPGCAFELHGHPNPDLERPCFVSEALHFFDPDDDDDGGELGFRYVNEFVAHDLQREYRPAVSDPPLVRGPETAVVVAEGGDASHCDRHGRVRVRFAGAGPEGASCWLRVAQAWAGAGYGTWFTPRPGMEVVVSFLGGHAERPMITGVVHNGANVPPVDLPEAWTQSTIRTQSVGRGDDAEGYNELRFEDAQGREQVFLRAQRRLDLRVRGSSYRSCGGNEEVVVGGENSGDLNTLARHDVNLHTLGNAYRLVDRDEHRRVAGTSHHRVDADAKVSVGEGYVLEARNAAVQTQDAISLRATDLVLEATHDARLKASCLQIDASFGIRLQSGVNYIEIHPTDGITIQGDRTFINSKPRGGENRIDGAEPLASWEMLDPIDALPASSGRPVAAGGRGGGRGRRRTHEVVEIDPHEPIPPPPPPEPPPPPPEPPPPPPPPDAPSVDPSSTLALELACAHGRTTTGHMLDVVPDPDTDTITATAVLPDGVPDLVQWQVEGLFSPPEPGTTAIFEVANDREVRAWPPPRDEGALAETTKVTASLDGSSASALVRCFPGRRFDYAIDFPFAKFQTEVYEKLLSYEAVREIVGIWVEDLEVSLAAPDDQGRFIAGFEEADDARAFFGYDVTLKSERRLAGEVGLGSKRFIKLGKRSLRTVQGLARAAGRAGKRVADILEHVGDFLEDFLSEAGVSVIFAGHSKIDVAWHRDSPDDPRLVLPTDDSEFRDDVTIGLRGSLGLNPVPALELDDLKVDVAIVIHYESSGMPLLSDDYFGARLSTRFKGIELKSCGLSSGLLGSFDAIERFGDGSPVYLVDPAEEPWNFDLDLTFVLEHLRKMGKMG